MQLLAFLLLRLPNYVEEESETKAEINEEQLTMKETLFQRRFWLLWLSFMSVQMMITFVNSYQKAFGQIFISDDYFFLYVGLASNILNGSSRVIWGFLFDRKGFKFNAFIIGGTSTFLCATFLFMYLIPSDSEMALKVFFGLWICGFYGVFPGIYATMAPATQATFGHTNYSRDYGLLFTQSVSFIS